MQNFIAADNSGAKRVNLAIHSLGVTTS